MKYSQSIPCPTCQTPIPFDSHELLKGTQFACPKCQAVIGLAPESRPVVEEAMQKFDDLKGNIAKQKQDHSMS
jgi:transcription initiation factor IIE alpha subunit